MTRARRNDAAAGESLPKYSRPPVVEVALSAQFSELAGFQPIHFGQLWELWRDRFPRYEHHLPLPSSVEILEPTAARGIGLAIREEFPVGRYWFLSDDGHRLIQIQPDRFVYNWRKLETELTYPSYDRLRVEFEAELSRFVEFAGREQLGSVEPTQAELTYVNHIQVAGDSINQAVAEVTRLWTGETTEELGDPEDVRLQWRYRHEAHGRPVGRLHVDLRTVRRARDGRRLVLLQLSGRGAPLTPDLNGLLGFTDLAHQWIVHGFTSITARGMHRTWERTQ